MSTPDTPKQRTQPVPTSQGTAIVRRMYRKPAIKFIELLGSALSERADLFRLAVTVAGDGQGKLDVLALLPHLPKLIVSSGDLVEHLLAHAVDGLSSEAMEKLDLIDSIELVNVALQLNAGAELKNSFAGIGKTLGALISAETPTSTGA